MPSFSGHRPVASGHNCRMTSRETSRLRQAMLDTEAASGSSQGHGEWEAWQRAATAYHLALHPEDGPYCANRDAPPFEDRAEILDHAAKMEQASLRVRATAPHRQDLSGFAEWSEAAGWWHETLAAIYPRSFMQAIEAVRAGDRSGFEPVVRFLEADPWCFRSGYVKEGIISALAHLELSEPEKERLRPVVITFVDYPKPRRELRAYVNLSRRISNPQLLAALNERLSGENPVARFNARAIIDGELHGAPRGWRLLEKAIKRGVPGSDS